MTLPAGPSPPRERVTDGDDSGSSPVIIIAPMTDAAVSRRPRTAVARGEEECSLAASPAAPVESITWILAEPSEVIPLSILIPDICSDSRVETEIGEDVVEVSGAHDYHRVSFADFIREDSGGGSHIGRV